MDLNTFADELLKTGQDLAKKGQALAEKKLQIPESGPEREKMLESLGKGAAVGGLLTVLLGTGAGRKLTGATLKVGSLAAIGTLAYQSYQKWLGKTDQPVAPVSELSPPAATARSLAILKAVIAAAKADGHMDEVERANIEKEINKLSLDQDVLDLLMSEIAKPLDVKEVAEGAKSASTAVEIYLASLAVIDEQDEKERAYLKSLAEALKLSPELIAAIEEKAKG